MIGAGVLPDRAGPLARCRLGEVEPVSTAGQSGRRLPDEGTTVARGSAVTAGHSLCRHRVGPLEPDGDFPGAAQLRPVQVAARDDADPAGVEGP